MKAISKITVLSAVSLCFAFAGIAAAQDAITPNSSTELFNGKDFSGWTFFERGDTDPMQTWSISDGMVHCTGRPTGYMRTEKMYRDFKVTAEWRFPTNVVRAVNTGVCVFMQDRDADAPTNQVWPHCVECQGMHGHMGDFWIWSGMKINEPFDMGKNGIKMLQPSNESPVGEWTTFQCICRSNSVEIVVNGKSMNKITGGDVSSGYIGIQSEGGPFDLRKVTIEPLE
jgi:hypothetical protein